MDIAPLGFAVDTKALEKGKVEAKTAAAEIAKLADAADDVGKAFDKAAKPTTDAAKAIEATGKASAGAKRSSEELATSQRAAGAATTATGKSTEAVAKITDAARRAADEYTKAMHGETTAATATGNAVAGMSGKITATSQASATAAKSVSKVAEAFKEVGGAADDAKGDLDDGSDAIDDMADNADKATSVMRQLWEAMGHGARVTGGTVEVVDRLGARDTGFGALVARSVAVRVAVTALFGTLTAGTIATGGLIIVVAAAAAAYAALVNATAEAQDQMAGYEARLKQALASQDAATSSMARLGAMANDVGVGLDTTIDSFARLAQNSKALGATREEMLQFVETVQKLGASTGTSSFDIEGAMMQLGQALAAGKLNGDELRSIMERMPPLADAIAKGMGKTVGELRAMGAEGQLTSDKVFAAILSQTEKARKGFEEMPDSVEKANKRMENSMLSLKAHIGEAINASEIKRAIINGVAGGISWMDSFLAEREKPQDQGAKATEEAAAKRNKAMADLARISSASSEGYSSERNKNKQRLDDIKAYQDQLVKAKVLYKELEDQAVRSAVREAEALVMLAQGRAMAMQGIASNNVIMQANGKVMMREAIGELGGHDKNGRISENGEGGAIAARREAEAARRTVAAQIKTLELGLGDARKEQADSEKKKDKEKGSTTAYQNLLKSNAELKKALETATGGGIDITQQALGLEGAKSTAAAVAAIVEQRSLEARKAVDDMEGAAAASTRMAASLREQGHATIELEAQNEALTWKYRTFGSTIADNSQVVAAYTAALIKQKRAEQELADVRSMEKMRDDQSVRTQQRDAFDDGDYAMRAAEAKTKAAIVIRNDPSREGFARAQLQDFNDKESFDAEKKLADMRREAARTDELATARSTAQRRAMEMRHRVEDARREVSPENRDAAGQAVVDKDGAERRANVTATTLSMRDQLAAMADQYELSRLAGEEQRVQSAIMERKRALMAEGVDLTSREAMVQFEVTEELERQKIALENHLEYIAAMSDSWSDFTQDVSGAMGTGFTSAFRDGENAGRNMFLALERAGFDFVDKLMRKLAFDPLMDALGNIGKNVIGSLFGGAPVGGTGVPTSTAIPNATGNVFSGGGIVPFATGGVVNRPTTFPMSGGRTGLMGEAGEEGIFPLKRGSSGKLGLEVSGSMGANVSIQINDMRSSKDSEPVKVTERKGSGGMRQIEVMIRDTVKTSVRRGEFDTDMNAQYGLDRTVTRR